MAFFFPQVPSPSPSVAAPDEFTATYRTPEIKRTKMLNIQDLLNPSDSNIAGMRNGAVSATPPPTPASTATSSYSTTSQPGTPATTISARYQKPPKGLGITIPKATGTVKYPPYELHEYDTSLPSHERQELSRQHKLFQVRPYSEKEDDYIADCTRHIPYSSDKKTFGGKTGRDGFDVFQYIFHVPGESTKFTVMWDYNNGLVRITPFFKACNYTKTTPAKALNTNAGLKDLAHSITGGALDAQGYWMPYSCARALCKTFCYDIRWALTPIFGPSFINECLEKDDPRFARFKIDPEITRQAQIQANAWMTPPLGTAGTSKVIPRSVPEESPMVDKKELRPRNMRPTFKEGSPFSSDSESTYTVAVSGITLPEISPKTTYSSPTWTPINRPAIAAAGPTSMPSNSLQNSLLNKPNYPGAWRPADGGYAAYHNDKTEIGIGGSKAVEDKYTTSKRRRSSARLQKPPSGTSYAPSRSNYDPEQTESEKDAAPIVKQPSVRKRARHTRRTSNNTTSPSQSPAPQAATGTPSRKYRAEDYRAANCLLRLHMHDADLATGPNERVDLKNNKQSMTLC